jgi:copper chaperone
MTYEFSVPDMSCGHCTARVEEALKPLGTAIVVDLDAKKARLDSEKPVPEILAALEEAGYPGNPIEG